MSAGRTAFSAAICPTGAGCGSQCRNGVIQDTNYSDRNFFDRPRIIARLLTVTSAGGTE